MYVDMVVLIFLEHKEEDWSDSGPPPRREGKQPPRFARKYLA